MESRGKQIKIKNTERKNLKKKLSLGEVTKIKSQPKQDKKKTNTVKRTRKTKDLMSLSFNNEAVKNNTVVNTFESLVLSSTYGLNNRHSKIISVGYHPTTLEPVVSIYDCLTQQCILMKSETAKAFFEKLSLIFNCIETTCTTFADYLKGINKVYQTKIELPIISNLYVQISLVDHKILVTITQFDKEEENTQQLKQNIIIFSIDEFNMIHNLMTFLSSTHVYNCDQFHSVMGYFQKYIQKCKELNVNQLNYDLYFEPTNLECQPQNFLKFFSEIPTLCKNALLLSLQK